MVILSLSLDWHVYFKEMPLSIPTGPASIGEHSSFLQVFDTGLLSYLHLLTLIRIHKWFGERLRVKYSHCEDFHEPTFYRLVQRDKYLVDHIDCFQSESRHPF